MICNLFEKKEKKVEYVELIYDLIFVFVVGRNNALLHNIEGGFVKPEMFIAYIICTLAVIQIWNFTTYYVNIHGRHSAREHVFMFINMFLLYFIGAGTRTNWQDYHAQYHVAWALILINMGIQYLIELKNHDKDSLSAWQSRRMAIILFSEAGIVLAANAEYAVFKSSWLSLAAILLGLFNVIIVRKKGAADAVDFAHLSERAMLYVVFTFGEMVVAISSYFTGAITANMLYFAAMAFLIVVGLFLSYGFFYDYIIDREKKTNGLGYICLHIFIIFALNNITNSLEFMQMEEVDLMPKMLLLIGSFVMFFLFLFATGRYAKKRCRLRRKFFLMVGVIGIAYVILMLLLRENMHLNIACTVICLFAVCRVIYTYGKKVDGHLKPGENCDK